MTASLQPSNRGLGLHVEAGVHIPSDIEIAPYVTIYSGVELGEGVALEQGAIIGRPYRVDPGSRSPGRPSKGPTVVGDGCRVGSGSVVVAGCRLAAGAYVADDVLLREGVVLGERAMIGRTCGISADVEVGARTRIQADCLVGPWTRIEEDVAVAPRVLFIGDPTMGRRPRRADSGGILVRRRSRIGAGATIFPPVEIGEEAVVGAMAMVRADVPERTVVIGSPARVLRPIREDEAFDRWRDGGERPSEG